MKTYRIIWSSILTVLGCVWIAQQAKAQSLEPREVPHHYVILVDASGSVRETGGKYTAYRNTLQDTLTALLYRTGFGDAIPAMQPSQDILSLYHFGIVPQARTSVPARRRLKNFGFGDDFIHPVYIAKPNISQATLRSNIVPENYYTLTALSWAKPLALSRLQGSRDVGRTFMLFVHDGVPNGVTVNDEIRTFERYGDPDSLAKTKRILQHITDTYVFTDGQGAEGIAFRADLPDDQNKLIFIEAYEVTSQTRRAARQDFAAIQTPLRRPAIDWLREEGSQPEGRFKATLSDSMQNLLNLAQGDVFAVALRDSLQPYPVVWSADPSIALSVEVPGPLGRERRVFGAAVEVAKTIPDSLLGTHVLRYSYRTVTVLAPRPTKYTILYYVIWLLRIAAVVFLALLLRYYIVYRYQKTHLVLDIHGYPKKVRIRRNAIPKPIDVRGRPRIGFPIFTLYVPRFAQHVFLRKASLQLTTKMPAEVTWETKGETTDILYFPTENQDVAWSAVDMKPSEVILTFRQGKQRTTIVLSYTAGTTP